MRYLIIIVLVLKGIIINAQTNYDLFFTNESLRIDLVFAGNSETEKLYLHNLKKEPFWGGSKVNLIDNLNYGEYKFEIFDQETGEMIFSRGFSTLFEEWQTTIESKNVDKSFYQTITCPFPKNNVLLKVFSKLWEGGFEKVFETNINPSDYFINPEKFKIDNIKLVDNGDPANNVDLVFIAEGYTDQEMDKFINDAKRHVDFLFSQKPFDKYKNQFNIWLVKSPSFESGTDIPGEKVYKNTVVNSNFYTFDSERYLMTLDVFKIRDLASVVPYDDICIMVNTEKYGGGGIYNHYAIFSADHELSNKVFVHEFGHSFVGLGDEYYNSSTSNNDFFNLETEPWQPNLTTLVNFDAKWKEMIDKKTPIPTPRESQYKNTTGVYEGGGYVSKGIYSPFIDCRMKSNVANDFCPVCQEAIIKMINFKSK